MDASAESIPKALQYANPGYSQQITAGLEQPLQEGIALTAVLLGAAMGVQLLDL